MHEGPLLVELRLPGEGGDTERAVGAARAFGVAAEDRFDATRVTTFAVFCADALLAALEETK